MPQKDYNWVKGCLALVITLALLFGGQLFWNKYAVAKPISDMFQSIKGVESVSIGRINEQGKNSDKNKIFVKLANVPDLQKAYTAIIDGLKNIDGGKKYDIVIQDNRTPELEQFFYTVHYYVQEASVNGNFAIMSEKIEAKAQKVGIAVKIYVDTKNIYLQMTKADAEMYMVIARSDSGQGVK
ncbi:hypothetical protein [Sporomusa aerivorans]|uniref:hypothetical protein n=1 Tax=Sporomusa aerivorans TaxID=204936 RepID=UPI00352AE6C1